jgi:hypothetical protein
LRESQRKSREVPGNPGKLQPKLLENKINDWFKIQ